MSVFLVAEEPWKEHSACKGADPKLFVLEQGYTADRAKKEYCSKCPVVVECFDYGIRTDSVGVWGGVVLTLADNAVELFPLRPVEAMRVEPISADERKRTPAMFSGTQQVASGFSRHPSILGERYG